MKIKTRVRGGVSQDDMPDVPGGGGGRGCG
jgi:hypothetical protein